MTITQLLILLLAVIVLGAAGWFLFRHLRLRRRFGPEYEKVVADHAGWLAAVRELRQRERRHGGLQLRDLDSAEQQRYAEAWQQVQARFVTDPAGAVVAGDKLVTRLIERRGYPTTNFDDELSYLSVEHARTLGHYRDAHEIYLRGQRGEAGTEDLRQALVHYRALFADLLGTDPAPEQHATDQSRTDQSRTDAARTDATDAASTDAAITEASPADESGALRSDPEQPARDRTVPTQARTDTR